MKKEIKDIAVIGIACRFPGAKNYIEFWNNLVCGVNLIKEIPPDRWDINTFYSSDINEPNKSVSKWCGLLDNIDQFDNRFFNISPREASVMDPQQRLLLEETWHCIEDSGLPLALLQRKKTSVYVGVMTVDYRHEILSPHVETDVYDCLGNFESILANRISYVFNLRGASISINAACASSLVAIHEAKSALLRRECDYAIVSSVNLNLNQWKYISFSKSRMLSPNGQCKTFDKDADGYVPGDGVGSILLQRLEDAEEAGAHVYGIIKGSAVNHGGKALSLTAPSIEAQKDVILAAYQDAGLNPETISYIEAHGTGTSLGDPIEIEALTQAFRKYTKNNKFCKIGSVKTNIGHLEASAGIAGIIKVLLMMRHRKIPATLNIKTINPIIDFEKTPFKVATDLTDWKDKEDSLLLRAGVSSFGFGGVNSHLLLEEFSPLEKMSCTSLLTNDTGKKRVSESNNLFVLSAKTPQSLEKMIKEWELFVKSDDYSNMNIQDVCATLLTGRVSFPYRYGKIVNNKNDLIDSLKIKDVIFSKGMQPWCLRINDLIWKGFNDIRPIIENENIFEQNLYKVIEYLQHQDKNQDLQKRFQKKQWIEKYRPIYSFIAGYSYISTLIELGFSPELVIGEKSGLWLSLAVSGIMRLEDIFGILTDNKELQQVKFYRPAIPFYDHVTEQVLRPYNFNKTYLKLLVDGLSVPQEVLNHFIQKARLLNSSQFTFKKYLEEWNVILKQSECSFMEMLYDDNFLLSGNIYTEHERLLFLVVILSSLQRLDQKWNLSQDQRVLDGRLYELIDLIVDDVLPKEMLFGLLCSKTPDFESIVDILNKRQNNLNLKNPYQYLKDQNQNLSEIFDIHDWIKKALLISGIPATVEKFKFLNLGIGIHCDDTDRSINLGISGDMSANLRKSLLYLWLHGVDIKWETLYQSGIFHKVSLPLYIFDHVSFLVRTKEKGIDKLHPLLHKDVSDARSKKFTTLFTGNEFYLKDHVVAGQKVLPGVACIEMACAAEEIKSRKKVINLKNIVWARPVTISNKSDEIQINLYSSGNTTTYEVSSIGENSQKIMHAQGELVYENLAKSQNEYIDIDVVKKNCIVRKSKKECYEDFQKKGLAYGLSLQSIQELFLNKNEALSILALPETLKEEFQNFIFHPTMLDGVLQTIVGLTAADEILHDQPRLPFSIDEVKIFHPLEDQGYAYVKRIDEDQFNAVFLNNKGLICIEFSHVSLRRYKNPFQDFFVLPKWKFSPLSIKRIESSEDSKDGTNKKIIFIIYSSQSLAFKKPLAKANAKDEVIEIELGDETKHYSKNKCKIKIGDFTALNDCITQFENINTIYFLGGIQTGASDMDDLMYLEESQEEGILSLFRLIKSLSSCGFSQRKLKLKVITNDVHQIQTDAIIRPYGASLFGLTKTIAKEYPEWEITCIDISLENIHKNSEKLQTLVKTILDEPPHHQANEVVIRNDKRYTRIFEPVSLPSVSQTPFKQNGVYLILGGGGGIGLELSRHLAETVQAKLVLIGLSNLSAEQKETISLIESKGGEVLYLKANAIDLDAMKAVVKETKSKFGKINGVIHSAIILRDKTLKNMDEETFRLALAPKIRGSVVLHKALKGEELDFMMFFSSILSFAGNAGQSNYIAGCTFKDAYAHYLNQNESYPVKIINWGYWGSVGIVANAEYKRRLSAQGLGSIEPKEGMEAIKRTLAYRVDQIISVKADKRLYEMMGIDQNRWIELYPLTIPSILETVITQVQPKIPEIDTVLRLLQAFSELEKFSHKLLIYTFQSMGVFQYQGERYYKEDLIMQLKIIPDYYQMFDALLEIQVKAGFIQLTGQEILTNSRLENAELKEELKDNVNMKKQLLSLYPEIRSHVDLLWACIQSYPDILTGKRDYMEIMFPGGDFSLVEGVYKGNVIADYYNQFMATIVSGYIRYMLHKGDVEQIKILEIGAGTGGTSKFVLEAIREYAQKIRYFYTDISVGFTQYGRKRFGVEYPFVEFKALNIEEDPKAQGFEPNSIDVVIGTNVIHATKRIDNTLNQTKKLLKTSGLFILNELIRVQDFITLIFGLTDGWWLFNDSENRLKNSPLIEMENWRGIFESNGFRKAKILGLPNITEDKTAQRIIIGESDGMVLIKENKKPEKEVKERYPEEIKHIGSNYNEKPINIPASANGLREKVMEYVKSIFSEVLQIKKTDMDEQSNFEKYGVDSLIVMELNKNFERDFGKLPVTLLFEYPSAGALTDYFIKNYTNDIKKRFSLERPSFLENSNQIFTTDKVKKEKGLSEMKYGFTKGESENKTMGDKPEDDSKNPDTVHDIAIIGVSGRYPMSESLKSFWKNLRSGKSCISEVPIDRWDWHKYYNPDSRQTGKSYSKWGGFINEVDRFDPLFFNISPKEAENMDPQERLFLETAWSLFEDAGITRKALAEIDYKVGVFVGVMNNNYVRYGSPVAYWSIANRVSYYFNLQGPSIAIDSACSASLTAIHLACESIKRGESQAAIAGGVNLILHSAHYSNLSSMNMLSRDEKCRAFGDDADGFVDGEGIGAVLLKPLKKAIADGDQIYAVIKGSFINAGGKTSGYTVPNPNAQASLIKETLKRANIDPRTISYIEAHGTGTSLGDPIEITGLTKAFKEYTEDKQYCSIGSVKSNIGHLESAAGIAGLTKVILQMKHKQLVPSIHTEKLNPNINFEESPFYIQRELKEWKQPVIKEAGKDKIYPRRAGISAFGAGGSNAHLILEEYEKPNLQARIENQEQYIIMLSAKDKERLKTYALEMHEYLEKNKDAISLADIAYTLHVGREPMEERLALVVSNTKDLLEKLSLYYESKADIENIFQGNVKVSKAQVGILIEGNAGKEFIGSLINDRKIEKLAQLWTVGIEIDKSLLYSGHKPNRISLPTYPFARDRYWISESENIKGISTRQSQIAMLHPLIDTNESTLEEQCYKKVFTSEDSYIKNHIVENEMMLPGVVHLEMARAAGNLAYRKGKVRKLKDIIWVKPVTVTDGMQDVLISLYSNRDKGVVDFEISTTGEVNSRIIYSYGKLVYDEISDNNEFIDIEAIRARCPNIKSRKECYDMFQSVGLQYGSGFRTIQKMYHNEREALSLIELPKELRGEFQDFVLHPSLMDGALQTVAWLMVSNETASMLSVPFSIGELEIKMPLPEKFYVYVAIAENGYSKDAPLNKFHIQLVDEGGSALVKIKDFLPRLFHNKTKTIQGFNDNELLNKERITDLNTHETLYFHGEWEKMELITKETIKAQRGTILFFDTGEEVFNTLNNRIKNDNNTPAVILVKPKESYSDKGNNIYEINPGQPNDYRRLFKTLREKDKMPDKIIHLWSKEQFTNKEDALRNQLDHGIYSIFHLSQGLMEQKIKGKIHLLYVYSSHANELLPQYAGVTGFAKTIHMENPNFIYKIIDLQITKKFKTNLNPSRLLDLILPEFQSEDRKNVEICYKDGSRFIKNYKEFKLTNKANISLPLKKEGVYVITGGAGGLGLIFAEHLARKVKARLVLVGRSDLSNEKQRKLQGIEKLGSKIMYIKADISQKGDVEKFISKARSRFGEIHGVIHSAGVIRDSLMLKKTKENMEAVLSPKVYGTIWLDEVTKEYPLDFFVMFSSIAAITGNIGQSDYAYGNSFMDNFSEMRRQWKEEGKRSGKTLSINWPLWESGGMVVPEDSIAFYKKLTGARPLSNEKGIQVFEDGLISPVSQLIVLEGEGEQIKNALNKDYSADVEYNSKQYGLQEKIQLQEKAEIFLKNIISHQIKLQSSKIQSEDPFERYGIDSVMILNVTRELEEHFGVLSKTLFFEYKNIRELTKYFIENHIERLLEAIGGYNKTGTKGMEEKVYQDNELKRYQRPGRFVHSSEEAENGTEDIAIIGLSGRYPMAKNIEEYWENLKKGKDCITEIPQDRWDYQEYYNPDKEKIGNSYSKWGGFIEDVDKFDPLFFNIAPREAEVMDPQERLFLETVWHTIEDAGYTLARIEKNRVGVFVGVMYSEYQLFGVKESQKGNIIALGSLHASIANRVSYYFNLQGPSIALDTMCSSSLTAIHLACESIRRGESELAIAGGINVSIHPNKYILLSQLKFASSDGRCRSFGEGGNGYVPGEGVGAVLLKSMQKAIEDGDHIYAVIKATAINSGGKAKGYTVPNPNAQASLIKETLKRANIDPRTISYIEAHGTGTSLGDPIEITGLTKAFREHTEDRQYCSIGSVKSNIGHLESAAGIAGLTKMILQMNHKQLVPSIHTEKLNPNINFEESPFYIQRELKEWKQPVIKEAGKDKIYPRRAGISAFGAGGSNAHLILEEYKSLNSPNVTLEGQYIIVLSARNEERLKVYSREIAAFLENKDVSDTDLLDISYTLQVGREPMEERLALVVSNTKELLEKLLQYSEGKSDIENVYRGDIKSNKEKIELLGEEEEGKEFLRKLLNKKKLTRLARLWVNGVEIEWGLLYSNQIPKRIPLPVYPFAKERYWVTDIDSAACSKTISMVNISAVHPLLHQNTSDLFEQRFSSTFTGDEFFLADHVVNGQKVLPGVAYLEMARTAVEQSTKALREDLTGISLKNIVWAKPISVNGQPVHVHIGLYPENNKEIVYEIYSTPQESDVDIVTHSSGIAHLISISEIPILNIKDLKAQCTKSKLSSSKCYELFKAMGIEYGSRHQGINEVLIGDSQMLAKLSLPSFISDTKDQFVLHPCLMDSALQASIGLMIGDDNSILSDDVVYSKPILPFALEELEIFGKCASLMWAFIRYSNGSKAGSIIYKFEIDLCDDKGNVCVRMKGLSLRTMESAIQASVSELPVGNILLTPVWDSIPKPNGDIFPLSTKQVVIIGGNENNRLAIQKLYPNAYALDIESDDTIENITQKLRDYSTIDHVIWIAPYAPLISLADEAIIENQNCGVLQVFRIIKAFLSLNYDTRNLGWSVITIQSQPIHKGDRVNPSHASINGLVGSLAKEYPNWNIRFIDLDSRDEWPIYDMFTLPADSQGEAWVYNKGEWYRQNLLLIDCPHSNQTSANYKFGGVYVVIGGAGGIGEVWSEYMIRNYKAQIIWIGRRKNNPTIQAKLNRLTDLGPAPLYISADASNLDDLQRAYEEIKQRYININGIVHSAIVLLDQSLANMQEEQFNSALSAKVSVSVRMVQVFKREPLDFVLFFSSMQSYVKAAGQSNYAAGCTFNDAFAHQLVLEWPCTVKIMNWGYWGSVGVVSSKAYQERIAQAGIGSIEPPEGMKATETLLVSPMDQIAMIKIIKPLVMKGVNTDEAIAVYENTLPSIIQIIKDKILSTRQIVLKENDAMSEMEEVICRILLEQLQAIGIFTEDQVALADLKIKSGLSEFYDKWLKESISVLVRKHYLHFDGALYTVVDKNRVDINVLWKEWEQKKGQWLKDPNMKAKVILLATTLRGLPDILKGKMNATDIIFPNASMSLVEGIFKDNPVADYFNEVLANVVVDYFEERLKQDPSARIRILEIGAGTGGTSTIVFRKLRRYKDNIEEYCYSDISMSFLLHSEKEYGQENPYLTYGIFDVSAPIAGQKINAGGYDLVIAANVLHATKKIRQTLQNAKAALKKNGVILLNEITNTSLFTHLTFGLLEGWWLYEDIGLRIPGCPGLYPETWQKVLKEEGFGAVFFPAHESHRLGQQIIVAESDGVVRQKLMPKMSIPSVQKKVNAEVRKEQPIEQRYSTTGEIKYDSLRDRTINYIKKLVGEILNIPAHNIDSKTPLEKYGIDSIFIVRLTGALSKVLNNITSTLFFEYQTIDGVADHLIKTQKESLITLVGLDEHEHQKEISHNDEIYVTSSPENHNLPIRKNRRFLKRYNQKTEQTESQNFRFQDIAIIGLAGRYPEADNIIEFWNNLKNGRNCIAEIPGDRWDWQTYFNEEKGKKGKIYTKWGGFIKNIDKFDPAFFQISPREAEQIDPQERLFLEIAYSSIEDAGYTPATLCGSRKIGVFVGVMNGNYPTGSSYWSIANRLSYFLNFQGPSIAVDTACSSSLTAIHMAVESLHSGTSECAIAGGVNLIVNPEHYIKLSEMTMLSSSNQCKSFGNQADGFVAGEGVGAIVLKPLHKANIDNDHIYGIIKGTMLSTGGKTNGYTVPNPNAQTDMIKEALKRTKIDPRTISYIEAHGTGTSLGDPIEITGLTKAFGEYTEDRQYCSIGSVKSNIGHLESAAGIAGLTKVLLQMKYRQFVPSLHSRILNPNIDFKNTPFVVQQELAEWKRPILEINGATKEYPRIAGISAFGAGGANAYVIIEEFIQKKENQLSITITPQNPAIIILSAKNENRLKEQVQRLLAAILEQQFLDANLADIAYTLQVGREAMEDRLAIMVSSIRELEEKLKKFLEGQDNFENLYRGQVKRSKDVLAIIAEDEDIEKTIDTWISRKKYDKLLDLWCKGLNVNWSKLYSDKKPHRISLPTYPFVQERYWLSENNVMPSGSSTSTDAKSIHSLADKKASHLSEDKSRSILSQHPLKTEPAEVIILSNKSEKPNKIKLASLSDNQLPAHKTSDQNQIILPSISKSLPELKIMDNSKPVIQKYNPVSIKLLQEELAISLAKTLYMEHSEVDIDKPFIDMGLDSVTGVEWVRVINKQYGISIIATKIYDYPTIREFAGFLSKELNKSDRTLHVSLESTPSYSIEKVLEQVYEGNLDIEQADQLL